MKRIPFMHLTTIAALAAACLPGAASAQYVWLDERGIKQYSDMPPPASVPANRIVKQPRGSPSAAPSQAPAAENPSPAKPEPTMAEKNAEFKKRRAEQTEKEKKAEDEARRAAEKAKNCERAREYQRALESGERIVRTDKNGERSFLTDEQRTQEMRDARRFVEDCK